MGYLFIGAILLEIEVLAWYTMAYPILLLLLLFAVGCFFFLKFSSIYPKSEAAKLPPGPKPWPILGNLLLLGDKPHLSLAKLSKTYGPVMSLKLGTVTTIVLSSPDMTKEMFSKHDLALSGRRVPDTMRAENHYQVSVVWLPISHHQWRTLRKIITIQMFTSQKLDASECLRQKKVLELVEFLRECCRESQAVDIGRAAFTTALNLLSSTFFSNDLAHYSSAASQEFKNTISSIMEMGGKPNIADYLPLLRYFDPAGMRRRSKALFCSLINTFDDIISHRLEDPNSSHRDDILDNLLSISKESDTELSMDSLKHLLIDLFVAGTDSASTTFEWAMTELLRNPEKMRKAQVELDELIGKNVMVQESDISKLPYLRAVVKETFRLHPPGPLLVPHKAERDVDFFGYLVPKNSQVMVNVWAMGRDENIWPNPSLFSPERFLNCEIEMKGGHLELIPFGVGRRICPGYTLAYRMLHMMLANVLHSFNWRLGDGLSPDDVNMDEKFGIVLQKDEPLKAVPLPN